MDWLRIGSVLLLVMVLLVMWPVAKHWLKNSPEGSTNDWLSALIPLALVGLFVAFLIAAV